MTSSSIRQTESGYATLRTWRAFAAGLATALMTSACAAAQDNETVPAAIEVTVTGGTFMALSDIHFGTRAPYHKYCGYMSETDQALWSAAQSKAQSLVKSHNPSFVIYTGDLPAHCDTPNNRKSEFKTTLDGLANMVSGTAIPVLFMPGNNDTIGGDYCSFSYADYPGGASKTPLDYASSPSEWPVYNGTTKIISQDKTHGYYSAYPLRKAPNGETSLRVIALNTVMFTGRYAGCVGSSAQQKATNAQLEWLSDQLQAAASTTPPEKVIIAMHVPAGVDGYTVPSPYGRHTDYAYQWSKYLKYTGAKISGANDQWIQKVFLDLVAGHQTEIVSILSGHTHLNGIRRVNDCAGNMTELNLSIPAITHDHGSNPAIKMISYDSNFELTEDETYYAERDSNNHYKYDWSGNRSFKFSTYYNCPAGQSCNTLEERVRKIGSVEGDYQLLHDMLSVLSVKPYDPPASTKAYKEALDTQCLHYAIPLVP